MKYIRFNKKVLLKIFG